MHIIDRIIKAVHEKQNPSVLGLDTQLSHIPSEFIDLDEINRAEHCDALELCASAIKKYNEVLISSLQDIIPAVKLQSAYYELFGHAGVEALEHSIDYARSAGLVTIVDGKRNDIGSTASAYAEAYLGETKIFSREIPVFGADMLTVNPYLGIDGIAPFSKIENKGIFVLLKTSNPSGIDLQNIICEDKRMFFEHVGDKIIEWGINSVGDYGYSSVGAVVGGTYPQEGATLRKRLDKCYFLVPGYGAQGGGAEGIVGCFDYNGQGALVNASRSLLTAHQKHAGLNVKDAVRKEALDMKNAILSAIGGKISLPR